MAQPAVAILGASTNPSKFGNISVRAHVRQGYTVYPVNPRAETIEGLKCYRSLAEIPQTHIERISVYLPPKLVLVLLDEISTTSHDELWLNPGTESEDVLNRAKELGLQPIQACSIVDLGISPSEV